MIFLIRKYYVHFIIVLILTTGLSILFSSSFFIEPKYKSFAIVYPHNINTFSGETATEQMLQILNSNDIHDPIIKEFDLGNHYELDKNYKFYNTKLLNIYFDNVSITKTQYESVEIKVYDKDPQIACDITNAIIRNFNNLVKTIQKEKFHEYLVVWEKRLIEKQKNFDKLNTQSDSLRYNYGLFDYEIQLEQASKQYYRTGSIEAKRALDNLKVGGNRLFELNMKIKNERVLYAEIIKEYENALTSYEKELTFTNIITKPKPAEKKSYPIRWLIVLISVCSTMLISYITIISIEKINTNKSE